MNDLIFCFILKNGRQPHVGHTLRTVPPRSTLPYDEHCQGSTLGPRLKVSEDEGLSFFFLKRCFKRLVFFFKSMSCVCVCAYMNYVSHVHWGVEGG